MMLSLFIIVKFKLIPVLTTVVFKATKVEIVESYRHKCYVSSLSLYKLNKYKLSVLKIKQVTQKKSAQMTETV